MAKKQVRWRMALVLLLGLVAPSTVLAGPYLGDWTWCWHEAHNCPRGEYCFLHFWTPQAFWVRAMVHPVNLDKYAPGPSPPVPPNFNVEGYPCRAIPPAPSTPYADPTAYYGRAIAPE